MPSGDSPRTAAGHTVESGYSSTVEPKNGKNTGTITHRENLTHDLRRIAAEVGAELVEVLEVRLNSSFLFFFWRKVTCCGN